ncbi:hypothetical protein QVD17_01702 [Tagetes erecta]|uniref:Agenet domain-containing protein n=1 Tax=Tagetes erecta TaxID=13708 RepID=A0AAD8L5B8_TARER|nr:hypothetical protein QVD17_01702 [Tagetes erecta]
MEGGSFYSTLPLLVLSSLEKFVEQRQSHKNTDTPMDYDDDEFQRQNRQLVGEGCSKVSSVLHPYALPKFDFDDTLHGHLNFNSLVENEVFLGLEDNQWIEEYSRGSSGIEFNSSGVELRRNNVWSEATSSESVEMLLNSVGQEEKVVGKALIAQLDPNISDETASLTKDMDPNLNQESQISGGELDLLIPIEKRNVSVLEDKVDSTFDDVILKEPNKDYPGSSENVGASGEEFSVIVLSKNVSGGAAEESFQIKENITDIPIDSDTMIVKSSMYGVEKSLSFVTEVEYVDKPSAEPSNLYPPAETSTPFSENLLPETSNPFSENVSAETSNSFNANPSAEISIPSHENLSANASIPFSENPSAEFSTSFSENPSTETSTPFSEKPSAENSILIIENLSAKSSIMFSETVPTETTIPFSEEPSTETSIPFSENLSTKTSIPATESPSTQTSVPFSEKPSAEINIPIIENLSAKTIITFSETPPTETTIPFSEDPSTETSIPFIKSPSTQPSVTLSEKASAGNSIPIIENLSAKTSFTFSETAPTETSLPFSENPSTETSTPFSENPSTETSIPSVESPSTPTSDPFSEIPPAENSIPFSERPSQTLKLKDPDSLKSTAGSLSKISPIKISTEEKENVTVMEKNTQHIISDTSMVSAGNLPETGYESSGTMQVDSKITSSVPGAIHLDQDDSFNKKEDASSPLESNDMNIDVVDAVDSQKNVEPSLLLDGSNENSVIAYSFESDVCVRAEQVSDQRSSPDTTTAENEEQPKSPIFGVSLVHQHSKETAEVGCPSEGNSQNVYSQVESVVPSVSKDSSALVEKEASPDLVEKAVHEIDAHCLTPIESCNASQSMQEHETKDGSQDYIKNLETNPFESSEKTGNISQIGFLQESKEPVSEVNKLNEHHACVDVARPSDEVIHDSSLPCQIPAYVESKAQSVSLGNATPEVKISNFEDNKRADLGQHGKGSLSHPTSQVSNLSKITEGPSKDSSSNQIDLRKFHEATVSPQSPSVLTSQIGVKGKSERKPRRKSVGKENARKETAPARDSLRGEITPVLLIPPATGQVTRFEEVRKPGVVLHSPTIQDLNNSTSIFQQPFTDNQQVQLRAQILVYGSLISGSLPEEAHMIAAFGQSDGGRTWEGVWRASLERLRFQQSQPKSGTPTQSRSDMRDAGSTPDQVIKQASIQNKVLSSPIGGQHKGTPLFLSPMIPFSSPLWNATTPDILQPSGMAKTAHFDHHQTLSHLRPTYQTPPPPIPNYNSSWLLSQGPFSGQWLAASPLPTFSPNPRFPSYPITESVKLTPVKESGRMVVKHTSNPAVLSSAPIIFPEVSSVSGLKRSSVSSDQPSSDPKSRKKIKGVPIVTDPCSTSVAVPVPAFMTSKSSPAKFLSAVALPTHTNIGDQNVDKIVISDPTSVKVEESKLLAKEAIVHADNAMLHCNDVWSLVQRRCNYDLNSNDEAKLVSSAVSIAAAASVAKVAAAAAKIASDVAEQARSMVTGLSKSQNSKAAPVSLKHAENLDAIVKAAELAADAVSQAGKIVAMSEPFSLRDLVEAGPEGYWKIPRLASKEQVFDAEYVNVTEKRNTETAHDKGILPTNSSQDLAENQTMEVDGTSVLFTSHEKDKRRPWARKAPEVFKTIGAIPESENWLTDTSIVGQTKPNVSLGNLKESDIKEGCLVEVYKDDDKHTGAWFGANVLSLEDGKALVSFTEIQSDEGSGKLTEWLPLEVEGGEAPKIRLAHPVTTMQGTRKRRRTAATDFMWSSGDRVDVWIHNHWREGVVTETNKIDTSFLTVKFPAQGEMSVRSWFVRPPLIWKDGNWVMCHASENRLASPGNIPQEKRLKLGSPIVESKRKAESSENIDFVHPRKQDESKPLSLSTHESIFNVGSTRDNKVKTQRTMRSGLQKEGSGVIFGVPKPGRKQKFMDVSKHYVADGSNVAAHDSIKFTRYLIPNPPGSRGWKSNPRSDPKQKEAAETKPQMPKSRKPPVPSFRGLSSKSTINKSNLDAVSDSENQPRHQNQMEHGSSSGIEDRSERLNKRKIVSTMGGKAAKVENSLPELAEPRRSNRKIQPTSRLLEGLQSSMTISKMPPLSHSTQRTHNKVITPKGNKNSGRKEQ